MGDSNSNDALGLPCLNTHPEGGMNMNLTNFTTDPAGAPNGPGIDNESEAAPVGAPQPATEAGAILDPEDDMAVFDEDYDEPARAEQVTVAVLPKAAQPAEEVTVAAQQPQQPKAGPLVNWDEAALFIGEIGRNGLEDGSRPIVLATFPQALGANIHVPGKWARELPRRDIHRLLQDDPTRSLGMVINGAPAAPANWGELPEHFSGRTPADREARMRRWIDSGKTDLRSKPKTWGASNAHIDRIVGGWGECDGGLSREAQQALPEKAGLPPATLRVWTGGKSLHSYWLLAKGETLTSEQFTRLQRALARALGGADASAGADQSLGNPARIMRVPGGWHPKGGRCVLDMTGGPRYTAAQLLELVEEIEARFPAAPRAQRPAVAAGGGGFLQPGALEWFNKLRRADQVKLAAEMLQLIPRRGEPGSGTYPAAFGAVCSLVSQFGSRGALEVIELAGWHSEHWDVVEKAEDVHSSGTERGIGSLIMDARAAGWVHPLDREEAATEAVRADLPTEEDIRGQIEDLRREMEAAGTPRPRWSESGWGARVKGIAEAIGAHVVARKAATDQALLMDALRTAAGGEKKGPGKQELKALVAAGATAQREREAAARGGGNGGGGNGGADAERPAAGDDMPFRVLGWDVERMKIHYQHGARGQTGAVSISGSGAGGLFAMALKQWWRENYPRPQGRGERQGAAEPDWEEARSALAGMADQEGIFDEKNMRGRGVWLDKGRVVWHQGEQLEVDGVETSIIDFTPTTRFTYPLREPLDVDPKAAPLTPEHGRRILEAVKAVGWKGADTHLLLAGWAVVSNVAGALKYRPAVQITGGYSDGKTSAVERVLLPLLPGVGDEVESKSSPAGVWQSRKSEALAVLLDECEEGDNKGNARSKLLEMARTSFDGKSMSRGTPGGEAQEYKIRFPMLLIGINAPIEDVATRSRFVIATKRRLPDEEWAQASALIDAAITPAVGDSLLRLTVSRLPVLLANVETFVRVLKRTHTEGGRVPDCCGTALAGAHFLVHPELVSEEEAAAWLQAEGWGVSGDPEGNAERPEAEGLTLLDQLLSHRPSQAMDNMRGLTLREMVALVRGEGMPEAVRADLGAGYVDGMKLKEAEAELGRVGLAALGVGGRKRWEKHGLFVSNGDPALREIFAGTRWAKGGHQAHLRALPGAQGDQVKLSSRSQRGWVIPWEVVEG